MTAITRIDVEARAERISARYYELDGVFAILRLPDGWRWHRLSDPGIGGEWRTTKREAFRDLADYLRKS